MAADVRDSDLEAEITDSKDFQEYDDNGSYASAVDSRITLNSEISSLPEKDRDYLPSHIIVQKQMKDVIISQRCAVQEIVRSNIDALNITRETFNNTYESQEERIKQLEQSIREEFSPRDEFLTLSEKLQEERAHHEQTKAHLSKTRDQLAASHQQLAKVEQTIIKDREAFDSSTQALEDKMLELEDQNSKLQFLLKEKVLQCEEMKGQVLQKTDHIERQTKKHEEQTLKFKQKVSDAEIEKQQEAYVKAMLEESTLKKKRKT